MIGRYIPQIWLAAAVVTMIAGWHSRDQLLLGGALVMAATATILSEIRSHRGE